MIYKLKWLSLISLCYLLHVQYINLISVDSFESSLKQLDLIYRKHDQIIPITAKFSIKIGNVNKNYRYYYGFQILNIFYQHIEEKGNNQYRIRNFKFWIPNVLEIHIIDLTAFEKGMTLE